MTKIFNKNFHKKLEGDYSFEVEFENDKPFNNGLNPRVFRLNRDGSLNQGYEVSLVKPVNREKLKACLRTVHKEIRHCFRESPKASTQIHRNVQNWTYDELFTVLSVYYLVEGLLFEFTNQERRSNLFCLPMYEASDGMEPLKYLCQNDLFTVEGMYNNHKYAALNVVNVAAKGSIEFRHLETTLDWDKNETWIDVIDCICESRKKFRDMDEVWEFFNGSPEMFMEKIFGNLRGVLMVFDWREIINRNYSTVFDLILLPLQIQRDKIHLKTKYKFLTEMEIDDLDHGAIW